MWLPESTRLVWMLIEADRMTFAVLTDRAWVVACLVVAWWVLVKLRYAMAAGLLLTRSNCKLLSLQLERELLHLLLELLHLQAVAAAGS